MTLPNILTLLRLVLIVPFCFFVTGGMNYGTHAFLTFALASITDWFDGYYARKLNQTSDAGKLLDPLADKLLVSTALIAFAADPVIRLPVWTVVLIIGREFFITGLRGMLAQQGIIMAADKLGKAKAASQMASILMILVAVQPNSRSMLDVAMAIYYLAVILTVASGIEYVSRNIKPIMASFKASPREG